MYFVDRFDQPIDLYIDQGIDRSLTVGTGAGRNVRIAGAEDGKTGAEFVETSYNDFEKGL